MKLFYLPEVLCFLVVKYIFATRSLKTYKCFSPGAVDSKLKVSVSISQIPSQRSIFCLTLISHEEQ